MSLKPPSIGARAGEAGVTGSTTAQATIMFGDQNYVFYNSGENSPMTGIFYISVDDDGNASTRPIRLCPNGNFPIMIAACSSPAPVVVGSTLYVFWNDEVDRIAYSSTKDMGTWSAPSYLGVSATELEKYNRDVKCRAENNTKWGYDSDSASVALSTSSTSDVHSNKAYADLQSHWDPSKRKMAKTKGRQAWLAFCFLVNIIVPVDMNEDVTNMSDSTVMRVMKNAWER